ncbi:starch synthase [Marinobacter persicus]|uniref:Glycogen synthase n=1 Tax=Marinobacter persicus TaxID=930118 RepID=A0A1I3WBX0_9GAMM|nr:glycogen synthase GlgA [Marinobacter persicus]GHD47144.1 glycogen synthase [Marinobacter persicus]SFK03971.1 starch synthase [Marinobacter persicus]
MMRILFATSEVFPLVKTGGLADVSASLPEALCRAGHDCQIILPGYPRAMAVARENNATALACFRQGQYDVTLWKTTLPGTPVTLWLVDCPVLFDRHGDSPYQDEHGQDWWDNAHRFQLFARTCAMLALGQLNLSWQPDVVHCNDWQTGLVPVFLRENPDPPATVFTIHNLAYQGLFPHETFRALALPDSLWHFERLEFHGRLSFIKGGLVYADAVTTVSPTYAREIQTPVLGYGLDGLLRHRSDRLTGILNGIDARVWDPNQDTCLPHHYSAGELDGKARCRSALQAELGLNTGSAPLLGFVGRLVEQKGLDWLLEILPHLLKRGCQFALLGSGEARYQQPLQALARDWPGQLSLTLGYDEALAHRITAGADLFLMPSKFEPCGLNQMYSLRYGTLPVVHGVGGLNDTVFDPTEAPPGKANGFVFRKPGPAALLAVTERALATRQHPDSWRQLQKTGMQADYSWNGRAGDYLALYRTLMSDQ